MRTTKFIAIALAVAGLALIGHPAYSGLSAVTDNGGDPQSQPAQDAPPQPTASPDDVDKATQIAKEDKRLAALIGDQPYSIVDSGPWTSMGGRRMIGTFLQLHLRDGAARINGRWPTMDYRDGRDGRAEGYSQRDAQLDIRGVTDLYVLVDLNSRRVASVQPNPDSTATPGPNEPRRTPIPGED